MHREILHFSLKFILPGMLIAFLATGGAAERRVFSGETEHGVKYTEIYIAPDDPETVRDDEDFDRYRFRTHWLQYEHPLRRGVKIAVRANQSERDFVDRPQLDNATTHAKLRMTIEPDRNWAIWPQISVRVRDYERSPLDNEILSASVEARYRWGVRDNIRFGASWNGVSYADEPARDRDQVAAFAAIEKPVSEGLTVKVRGRIERSAFDVPSASRENATRGSAAVGFRWEF
jgi:hypothetical protein